MYVLLFFACSFLGWCMEVTCKLVQFGRFINRGFLLGPLCPIYGTGAVLMAYFLPLWTTQVESTFLLALVLCGMLEYITSWLMEKLFHARWWDYSQKRFNINGRVCASNLLAFGVMGVFVVKVLKPFAFGLFAKTLHAFPEVQFYNKAHLARLKAKRAELQANMREKREKLQQEIDRLEEKRKALKKGKK